MYTQVGPTVHRSIQLVRDHGVHFLTYQPEAAIPSCQQQSAAAYSLRRPNGSASFRYSRQGEFALEDDDAEAEQGRSSGRAMVLRL